MKKRIVIVEDDIIIQELHRYFVESLGHEVAGAFMSGQEAIDFFKNNSADLILMDIRLEDSIDGIETMRKIQELSPAPVVYVSGNTDESNFRRALNTNMKGFLSKPVEPGELERIIDSLTELNDSIIYAERIQKALFPQWEEISSLFPGSIYLNRPKQIISGDFLCLQSRPMHQDLVGGIGDCTGHGVPAALLSVLSHEILRNCIRDHVELKEIIHALNTNIIRNFSGQHKINDSLDLILFRILTASQKIEIAGIKRPFIHFQAATGTHHFHNLRSHTSLGTPMEDLSAIPFMALDYSPEDYFYFFSDGITDQFGGPEGKKLKKKGFLAFLESNKHLPPQRKQIELDIFMRKWQHNSGQTDDILLIGICPSHYEVPKHTKTA